MAHNVHLNTSKLLSYFKTKLLFYFKKVLMILHYF